MPICRSHLPWFNHLIDELGKCPSLKQKVEKARESRPGSHRRTTEWLWNRVDIALELHQQKINRQEFDRTLKGKPQVLGPSTQLPKGADTSAAPAPTDPTVAAAPATREKKKKKKKNKEDSEVPATPAPKGKGKGKSDSTPRRTPRGGRGGNKGDTTPRSDQACHASQRTKEEKARTPCMFYAFGLRKAAKCEFLHDEANKYTGLPPTSLAARKADPKANPKPKPKPKPKAAATIAPLISAMPAAQAQEWIWDTGAGRHLIGKQALKHKAAACLRRTDSPVGFATGGGAREGNQTLSFEGSRLLPKGEQVYVLKECPPALSIGKTVIDGGHLFVWNRLENQPYLVAKADVHRCKLRVPRSTRINATRVVEYVPQFDEQLQPRVASSSTSLSLSPVTTALPSPREGEHPAGEVPLTPIAGGDSVPEGYAPTEIGSDDEDVAIVESYAFAERVRDEPSGRAEEAPAAPEAEPPREPEPPAPARPEEDPRSKEDRLRAEALSEKHLRTHFPENSYCICSVAKTTSADHQPMSPRSQTPRRTILLMLQPSPSSSSQLMTSSLQKVTTM